MGIRGSGLRSGDQFTLVPELLYSQRDSWAQMEELRYSIT